MAFARKFGIILLVAYTLIITVLRAIRTPNDFAEVHWLLDYRFGFVKRGLVGEIVALATNLLARPITAELIAFLASIAFGLFCITIALMSLKIIRTSHRALGAVLVTLVFLSSPFMVMSAHLIGYYDNLIIMLGVLSILVLHKGRIWPSALLQILALLIHENSLLLVFPSFCLAWLLLNSQRHQEGVTPLPIWPLLLPAGVFLGMVIYQEVLMPQGFVESFTAYLSQFPFLQRDSNHTVPVWIDRSFLEYYSYQSLEFPARLSSSTMYGLVLAATLAILSFLAQVYRIRTRTIEPLAVLGVCLVPQLMHLIAWDTTRIWTYTIFCAFFVLWIYATIFSAQPDTSLNRYLCLAALVVNALVTTPLMDGEVDHLAFSLRLLLYAPIIGLGIVFTFYGEKFAGTSALAIQGHDVTSILFPNRITDR